MFFFFQIHKSLFLFASLTTEFFPWRRGHGAFLVLLLTYLLTSLRLTVVWISGLQMSLSWPR